MCVCVWLQQSLSFLRKNIQKTRIDIASFNKRSSSLATKFVNAPDKKKVLIKFNLERG